VEREAAGADIPHGVLVVVPFDCEIEDHAQQIPPAVGDAGSHRVGLGHHVVAPGALAAERHVDVVRFGMTAGVEHLADHADVVGLRRVGSVKARAEAALRVRRSGRCIEGC
jgi:hypothetical protein